MSCPCELVVLPQDSAILIILPDTPACCCDEPEPVQPGFFYDGTAIHDGSIIFNSTIA